MIIPNIFRLAVCLTILFTFSPLPLLAASLNDIDAVPHLDKAGRAGYRDFIAFDKHKAFAIAPGGAWSWNGGESSVETAKRKALYACREQTGQTCVLYAVDDDVVFDRQAWPRLWGPYLNRADAAKSRIGQQLGDRFYDLAFTNGAGKRITLGDLKGKVILLHFWGSWCSPCRSEMPELQKLYKALGKSSDIRMVLLQVRENADLSRQWMRQQHLRLPFYDSGVKDKAMDSLMLADGKKIRDRDIAVVFPTTYVLDKHGIVVFSHTGPVTRWSQYLPFLRDVATRSGK